MPKPIASHNSIINHTFSKRLFRPGSLYQLTLAGLVVIILPLVLAFIYALVAITQYTSLSQQTLFNTVIATDGNRIILQRLISMERNIRQFQILKDPELFKGFQDHHQKFKDVAVNMEFDAIKSELQNTMDELLINEERLYQTITKKIISGNKQLTKNDFKDYADLTLEARQIVEKGRVQLGQEAEVLSIAAKQLRQNLIFSALVAIPLALIPGLIFVSLLTKPIKHIGQAIREIGKGSFDQPVKIHGPKDLQNLGKHLEWLRLRLNYLENEKQAFIKNISHELKTPLATLKEGSGILEDEIVGELNQEQQEIVQLMRLGCIQLNGLIENLLEYQKAISIQTRLDCCEFDLTVLIQRIIEEYRLIIKFKRIKIVEYLSPQKIVADRDKIRVIISNLLSNALKFGLSDSNLGISLRLHNDNIYLLIEDQGKGIPKQEQEIIFNEFYQSKSPGSWPVRGSGLGLKLVRDYVHAHHGAIKLLQPDKKYSGARFLVKLPIDQDIFQGKIQ